MDTRTADYFIKVIKAAEKLFNILRNVEKPLLQIFLRDRMVATLTRAVNHLLICQDGFARLTPIHRSFLFVGQSIFVKLKKNPLRPFVILRIGGRESATPVKAESDRFHLSRKVFDRALRRLRWMHASLNRIVFSRQTEGIKSHRKEDVLTIHPRHARHNVKPGIRLDVPHMQPLARRIRKHDEVIKRITLLRRILAHFSGMTLLPTLLPFRFDFFVIVGHRMKLV